VTSASANGTAAFTIERDFAGRQTLGTRSEQQDSYAFCLPEAGGLENAILLVLADGMGGHYGGAEAAETVVQNFVQAFLEDSREWPKRLPVAMERANQALASRIESNPELESAGTTLLAAAATTGGLAWISVGDSPLYLYRNRTLRRLNADHSMRAFLAEKAARGEMRASDIDKHPERSLLLSALIGLKPEKVDFQSQPVPLSPGDWILASSDGLLSLKEKEILKILRADEELPAAQLASNLLQAVFKKKLQSQDNTTVCLVRIPESPDAPATIPA
jgi:serine/threonine protein phosphatase PrpC